MTRAATPPRRGTRPDTSAFSSPAHAHASRASRPTADDETIMVTPSGSRGSSPARVAVATPITKKKSSPSTPQQLRSRGNSPTLKSSSNSATFPPSRGSDAGSIERFDVSSRSRRLISVFNQHEDNINVVVRVRPLNAKETKSGDQFCAQFPGNGQILLDGGGGGSGGGGGGSANSSKTKLFSYNVVFEPAATQEDILQYSGIKRLIEMAVEGFRCTAFCYGQTGSGKTHTLTGPPGLFDRGPKGYVSDMHGLVFRSFAYLFQLLEGKPDVHFVLKASFLEIYNEKVIDLLNPGSARKPLAVRWSKKSRGFFVENLFTVDCEELDDLTAVLEEGMRNRRVGSHSMNDYSSRSHTILSVHITSDQPAEGGVFISRSGKMNFVDLAGSEMTKKTHSEGKTLEEANNINKSLMVLGYCIASLSDNKRKSSHIPYRDSKLTKLLADSLAGNGVTLMIACISPAKSNLSETINTLRYAARAKKIKTKPIVLMDPREALIISLKREVEALQSENEHLRNALHLQTTSPPTEMRIVSTPPQVDLDRLTELEGTQLVELVRLYVQENEALRKENAELYVTREMMLRDQELVCRENERLLRKLEDVNSVCCRSPINPPSATQPSIKRNVSTENLNLTSTWGSTILPDAIQKELTKRRIGDSPSIKPKDVGLVDQKDEGSKKKGSATGRRYSMAKRSGSLDKIENGASNVTSPTEDWVMDQRKRVGQLRDPSAGRKKLFGSAISLVEDI